MRNRRDLKRFLARLAKSEGVAVSGIDYIFCDDAYLLGLNRKFLQHNTYTDIITFPLSDPGNPLVAEIYISLDRVRDNAATYNVPVKAELLRVIFHGLLHLCGYGDKTQKEKELMRLKEDHYLKRYNVSRGTK